jgi:mannan endo-1,4-beta-mannosidase
VHVYPEAWGVSPAVLREAGERWIAEHAAIARRLGKPLVVGELGLRADGALGPEPRRNVLRAWLARARAEGALLAAPWLLADEARLGAGDPYALGGAEAAAVLA